MVLLYILKEAEKKLILSLCVRNALPSSEVFRAEQRAAARPRLCSSSGCQLATLIPSTGRLCTVATIGRQHSSGT